MIRDDDDEESRVMSAQEFADLLGVSRSRVYQILGDGRTWGRKMNKSRNGQWAIQRLYATRFAATYKENRWRRA